MHIDSGLDLATTDEPVSDRRFPAEQQPTEPEASDVATGDASNEGDPAPGDAPRDEPSPDAAPERSTLASVFSDLMAVVDHRRSEFDSGAEQLDQHGRSDLATTFRRFADQRRRMGDELRIIAASRGFDVDGSETIGGLLHRSWNAVRDALTGDDVESVLEAAERGEDDAVARYERVLARWGRELDEALGTVLVRHREEIREASDAVRVVRDSAGS